MRTYDVLAKFEISKILLSIPRVEERYLITLTEPAKKLRRPRIFSSLDRKTTLMHRVVKALSQAISNLHLMNQHSLLQLSLPAVNHQADLPVFPKVYLR